MRAKLIAYAVAAGMLLGGIMTGSAGWYFTGLYYQAKISGINKDWATERASLVNASAEMARHYRELEAESAGRQKEIWDESANRIADLNHRWGLGYDKLREAYQASCSRAGAAADGKPSAGEIDDPSADNGYSGRVAERLQQELVVPVDAMAENLLTLQQYVKTVPCIQWPSE